MAKSANERKSAAGERTLSAASRLRDVAARRAAQSVEHPLEAIGASPLSTPAPDLKVVTEPDQLLAEVQPLPESATVTDDATQREALVDDGEPPASDSSTVRQAKRPAKARASNSSPAQASAELIWILAGPETTLDMSGEEINKMTMELPKALVDVLSDWEQKQFVLTGKRVFRERFFDLALDALPTDPDEAIALTSDLPRWLKYAPKEQVGTRVRASRSFNLQFLRGEIKKRRVRGVYMRDLYTVAILRFLQAQGVTVEEHEA